MPNTPFFIDPVARAVEQICLGMLRQTRVVLSPHEVKIAILSDMRGKDGPAPTVDECAALIECIVNEVEPKWVLDRWTHLLILLELCVRSHLLKR